MSFQPGKKKSLSDRFGGISSNTTSSNRDLVQRLDQPNYDQNKNDSRNRRSVDGNSRDPRKPGTLTVHLKINQTNRNARNESSYVNRPNRPCRIEYQDKPSELTKHFNRRGSDGGKENSKRNYYPNFGRQVSVKDTPTGSQSRVYNTSPRYNRNNQTSPQFDKRNSNQSSPRYTQNHGQSSPQFDKRYNDQLSPRYIQNHNQTSTRYNGNAVNQTSPQYNQNVNESLPQQTTGFSATPPILQLRDNIDRSYGKDNFQQRNSIDQSYLQNRSCPPFQQCSTEIKINSCNSFQSDRQCLPQNEPENRNIRNPFQQFYDDFNGPNQTPGPIASLPPINTTVNKSPGFYGNSENKELNGVNGMQFDQNTGISFLNRGTMPLYKGNTNSYLNNDNSQNTYKIPGICEPPPTLENTRFCKNHRQTESVVQNSNDYTQSYDRPGFSSNPPENQNIYPGSQPVIDDFNYNSTATNSRTRQYNPLNSNVQSCVNNGSQENFPSSGGISPKFSPDSDMSLDSNTAVQSKENVNPTGFYTDLSEEVFPEVEALKKKFFKECDSLSKTAQDKQLVSVVKNILQTTTDLAVACNSNTTNVNKKSPGTFKKGDKSPAAGKKDNKGDKSPAGGKKDKKGDKSPATGKKGDKSPAAGKKDKNCSKQTSPTDESKKDMDSSKSPSLTDNERFEGRTLLKGGVKPRHVPKMLIDKPGLDPPTDRRMVYNTARNLLELPLPKWAEEIFGKGGTDKDISSGINQERKSNKSPVKTDNNQNIVNTNKEKKDQTVNKPTKVKVDVAKNSSSIDVATTTNSKTVISGNSKTVKDGNVLKKKLKTDDQSKDNKSISNKKMKVDGKNTIDLTLGGAVMSKRKEINKEVQAKGSKEGSVIKNESSRSSHKDDKRYYPDNAKKDKSNSRESSRSRRSRSRSRSRNRSRSRDSRRRPNRQSEGQYRRSEQNDYRSRSRDVRRRSPVKTSLKPFAKCDSDRQNLSAFINKGLSLNDYDQSYRNHDLFDQDRNGFRAEDDNNLLMF